MEGHRWNFNPQDELDGLVVALGQSDRFWQVGTQQMMSFLNTYTRKVPRLSG